jgi:hypothetical protein
MSGLEWRVVVTMLLSPTPMSAKQIAGRLRTSYGFVKRMVRGLVAWRILERTPVGIRLQPEHTGWAPPRSPVKRMNDRRVLTLRTGLRLG